MKYFERTIKLESQSTQSASAYINLAIMENQAETLKKHANMQKKLLN